MAQFALMARETKDPASNQFSAVLNKFGDRYAFWRNNNKPNSANQRSAVQRQGGSLKVVRNDDEFYAFYKIQ